jgi:glycosyltransferase involved in cell wall biosynthesis
MARIGINPARGKQSAYRPAKITVAMLSYIPHLEGYFRHRLDVLKLALASIKAHTDVPHDLLVFDNGSCRPVVDHLRFLRDEGMIDYLLLSRRNLGKIGAFRILFNAAPGDIVAYADDDIFFYPGWLPAHMNILETFPEVGMVSGIPVRDASERARSALMNFVKNKPSELNVSHTHQLPEVWEADWAVSVGRDPKTHLEKIRNQEEWILTYKDVDAYGSASHFQFLAPKHVIQEALPDEWQGNLMGSMLELDETVDTLGYLRLSTMKRYTRHLGNVLNDEILADAESLGITVDGMGSSKKPKKHWLLKIPGSGRVLRAIYDRLFLMLHQAG